MWLIGASKVAAVRLASQAQDRRSARISPVNDHVIDHCARSLVHGGQAWLWPLNHSGQQLP